MLAVEDFPAFSEEATAGDAHIGPATLEAIAATLTEADIPTFERALRAMDEGDLAWLGFKVVYDGAAAQGNVDNEVTKKYGEQGSADRELLVFFCNDAKEIVASRELSPRDIFQAKDVTRGPSMHNDQFDGLTWASEPLFGKVRVWLLGASDAAVEVAQLADHVGFHVVAVDYDPAFLNEERFPHCRAHHAAWRATSTSWPTCRGVPEDYVCVLTRGHMFDPESCVWALQNGVHYVGMMGCAGKNSTVHDLVINAGISEADWDRVKRPIGLKLRREDPGGAGHRHRRPSWWTCATSSATATRLAGPPREEPGAGVAALACARAADGKAVGKRGSALPQEAPSVIPCSLEANAL